jgi:hypothetical protein
MKVALNSNSLSEFFFLNLNKRGSQLLNEFFFRQVSSKIEIRSELTDHIMTSEKNNNIYILYNKYKQTANQKIKIFFEIKTPLK